MNKIRNVFLTILAIFTLSSELQANFKDDLNSVIGNRCTWNVNWKYNSSSSASRYIKPSNSGDSLTLTCTNMTNSDMSNFRLKAIRGSLTISGSFTNLGNFGGVIQQVTQNFTIKNSPNLTDITLASYFQGGRYIKIYDNPELSTVYINSLKSSKRISVTAYDETTTFKEFYVTRNPKLATFQSKVINTATQISLSVNKISNLRLDALTTVYSSVYLSNNNLANLYGIRNLKSIGNNLSLNDNPLTSLTYLNNSLTNIPGTFRLHGTGITSFNGIDAITNIGGSAIFSSNINLTSIASLNYNLVIGSNLYLYGNTSLSNISRLGTSNILLKGDLYLQNTAITDYSPLNLFRRYNNHTTKIDKTPISIKAHGDSDTCKGDSVVIKDKDDNTIAKTILCSPGIISITKDKCVYAVPYGKFNIHTGFLDNKIKCDNSGITDTDLSYFSYLKSTADSLESNGNYINLSYNNLTNVNGLKNLKKVGDVFYLNDNPLTDISKLSNLTKIQGHFRLYRTNLTNFNGLQNLTSISKGGAIETGSFVASLNPNLNDISALNTNLYIAGQLSFYNDTALTNISRVENMAIGFWGLADTDGLRIDGSGVTNTAQIENANFIKRIIVSGAMNTLADGDLTFCDNTDLEVYIGTTLSPKNLVCLRTIPELLAFKCGYDLATAKSNWNYSTGVFNDSILCKSTGINDYDMESFRRLKIANHHLQLSYNDITTVEGLRNLQDVKTSFYLEKNNLNTVFGLRNLTNVNGNFYMHTNPNLTNLNGLGNLTNIGGQVIFSLNNLTDINGLSPSLSIASNFSLYHNPSLSNVSRLDTISVGGDLRLDQTNVTDSQQMKGYTPSDNATVRFPAELLIKADYNSPLCSYVKTILYTDNSSNSLLRTQVCKKDFRSVINEKCGVSLSDAYNNFNTITGKYTGEVRCDNKGINDNDLDTFNVLKDITSHLLLNGNDITNTVGLVNLQTVGNSFYLQENLNLTQLNLNSLTSIGWRFYLHGLPLLTSFNSLQNLTNITKNFSASTNGNLTDISALNSALNIGTDLTLYNNYSLSDVSVLDTITVNGGNIWLYNTAITDAKQFENINIPNNTITMKVEGPMTTKASPTSNICRRVNPLSFYDDAGTILKRTDICEEVFVDVLELKCNIPNAYTYFNDATGIYSEDITCTSKNLTSTDIDKFLVLKQAQKTLMLGDNNIVKFDGLSNLTSISQEFNIADNTGLNDVTGLSNLTSIGGVFNAYGLNSLTNLSLPSLTNITGSTYINKNPLLDTISFNPLLNINGIVFKLSENPLLTNISTLNNITFNGTNFQLAGSGVDDIRQIVNMNFTENNNFAFNVDAGQIRQRFPYLHKFCNSEEPTALTNTLVTKNLLGANIPLKEVCMPDYDKDEFVLFDMLENKCNMPLGVDVSFEIDTKEFKEDINCASSGLVNSDVDALRPIKSVLGSVYLNNNPLITSSFGTANIASLDTLDYSNTNIVDLDISNYNTINTLDLSNNSSLSDIQGLNGVNIINSIYINGTSILDLTSFEVVSFSNGSGSIYADNKTYSKRINQNFNICSNPSYVFRDAGGSALSKSIFCKDSETTAPFISSSTPANNANSVSILSNILISFSEKLYATNGLNLTELSSIFTITDKLGKNVDKQVLFDNNSNFQILIAGGLKESETYTIKLNPNSVADESGNINSQQTIVFQTIDTESPYIIDQYPLANSVTMNPNSDIVLRFNEAITNYTSSFTLTDNNGVSVSLSYSLSGNDLTISHSSLDFNTLYTLQSIGGVIRDLAGNVISGQKFSFTTLKSDGSAGTIKERAGWNGVHREGLMFIKTSNSELKYALGWLKSHDVVTLDISKLTKYLNLIRANYTTSSGVQQSYLSALQTLSPADLEQFKALVK